MKLVFVHLSGSKRGVTEVFTEERLKVGTDPGNELRFDASVDRTTAPFHAEVKLKDCDYLLKNKESRTPMVVHLIDGEIVRGVIEYYDRDMVKINRDQGPNLFIRKAIIRYMHKEKEG